MLGSGGLVVADPTSPPSNPEQTSRHRFGLDQPPWHTVTRMNTARISDQIIVPLPDGTNNASNPISAHNYGKIWKRAKASIWPSPHPLAGAVPYDLRHSAATTMLAAGVNPAEAARRLGHSVDMLMRVYAGVFNDERDRANLALDAFSDGGSAGR